MTDGRVTFERLAKPEQAAQAYRVALQRWPDSLVLGLGPTLAAASVAPAVAPAVAPSAASSPDAGASLPQQVDAFEREQALGDIPPI